MAAPSVSPKLLPARLSRQEPRSGNAAGAQPPRLRPHAKDLTERLWYGGGSQGSAAWAARAGFNLLTGDIVSGEGTDNFFLARTAPIQRFLREWRHDRPARVALGRVVLPTDGASAATRRRYLHFAASRHEKTLKPRGARRTPFGPHLVGTRDDILRTLSADPVVPLVSELRLELPYEFEARNYEQIIADFARLFAQAGGGRARAAPIGKDAAA